MRALNKICDKATAYKKWIDDLIKENGSCANYYSGHKYYKDIVANLLIIQGGVCAYTEVELDDVSQFSDAEWVDGTFIGASQFDCSLDHFDSSFKKMGAKSYLWENFFAINQKINNQKNDEIIFDILKPDNPNYSPDKYLTYDSDLDIFRVNDSVTDPDEIFQIEHMIDKCVLLNYGPIKRRRRKYLNKIFLNYYAGIGTLEGIFPDQFFTAVNFLKEKYTLNPLSI